MGKGLGILAVTALAAVAGATPGHAFGPGDQTAPPRSAPQPAPVPVIFETALGNITMEVDPARAPITAANFLKYVDGKFYDGGMINRAVRPDNTLRTDVPIQVIQFQSNPARRSEMFPPIPMERTSLTGLKHLDGSLSMARSGPDTATSSFSITIGDQPEMDFGGKRNADGQGFAVFGRVVAGMDVVKKIHQSQTRTTAGRGGYGTETLDPPIAITRAYRAPRPDGLPEMPLPITLASGPIAADGSFKVSVPDFASDPSGRGASGGTNDRGGFRLRADRETAPFHYWLEREGDRLGQIPVARDYRDLLLHPRRH
jgi:peptidyl-prolyl cis-trans isomerase A (cyclophilin A)